MPTYEHLCESCNYEWEDLYSMSDPVPEECPECKIKGKVKRLISWCSGVVELTGKEAVHKAWADGKKMAQEMKRNENKAANFVGEDNYQKAANRADRIKKDFGKNA